MLLIYVVAGMAVLVWGAVFAVRGPLVGGCLVYLLVAMCFGHHFFNFDVGPLPLTFDRLLLVLLIAAYVLQRRWGRTDPKPLGRVDVLLALFLGVSTLSLFYGLSMGGEASLTGEFGPLYRLVAGYMIPAILYWIARQSPLDRARISLLHGSLVCLGIYLAVTGLLEISGQWWAVVPRHIANPKIGIHFGRSRGPMVNAVSFGLYLGVCLVAVWSWRWRFGRRGRWILVASMPLLMAAIYSSYTRSVWIGAGLALMVVFAVTLRGKWRPLVLGSMASAALLIALTQMDRLKGLQREQSAAEASGSVDLRVSFAYVSWLMFQDRPLAGVGFGQFPKAKLAYLSDRSTQLNLESTRPYVHHNTFLSVLTETGLVGLALFLAVLAGWGQAAWRLSHDRQAPDWMRAHGVLLLGVLAVYCCQLAFHEMSYSPIDNSLVFLLAGVTVGLRAAAAPQPGLSTEAAWCRPRSSGGPRLAGDLS